MKIFSAFFLTLLQISFSAAALANDCSPVNLYEIPKSPLLRMRIYDQGEMDTCYAYTAAEMVDYYRFSTDPTATEMTSPIWTALIHKIHVPITWNPDSLDFSRMAWVFKDLEKFGICKESVVNRAIVKLKNGNKKLSDSDVMYLFQNLWDAYQANKGLFHSRQKAYDKAYASVVADPYFEGKIQNSMAANFKWVTLHGDRGRLNSLMSQVFSECANDNLMPIKLPKRASAGLGFASNAKLENRLNEILDKKEPVGIGYCATLLDNGPGYRGIKIKPRFLGMALNNKDCGAHYSVVVGKRPVAAGCEYLIRNSWGKGFWTDEFPCYCQTTNKVQVEYLDCKSSDPETKPVKVLGCWVNAQDLAPNLFDMTYFR